jgi:hypothetical protein
VQHVEQDSSISGVRNGRPDDRNHTGGLGPQGGLGLESSHWCQAVAGVGLLPRAGIGARVGLHAGTGLGTGSDLGTGGDPATGRDLGVPRCVPVPGERREVLQQRLAVLREDRLRMELNAPQGPGAVLDALDDAVL